ncbi:MAG: BadF/BadG/BcrA/BcrD ATPase family protein [Terriglobales bacterium]
MGCVLGIDGGGSKSAFLAAGLDDRGTADAYLVRLGSSLSRSALREVELVVARGCQGCLAEHNAGLEEVAAVCGGFASAGRNRGRYEAILAGLMPQARVRVMSDAELAWWGATGGKDGLVVVAGTGSVVWGRYQGREAQAGGEGPGRDPGSGDQIGREAVAAGLSAAPGDGNYAGLLPRLTREHGQKCEGIFRRAAADLTGLVRNCACALRWETPEVYYWGGVFDGVQAMREYIQEAGGYTLQPPKQAPVTAAVELARALVG